MTWIEDNKDSGPWSFEEQKDKIHYNEGNLISDYDAPVWATDFFADKIGKTPITPEHHPHCGYWTKEYVPWTTVETLSGTLYSTGENDYGNLALGDSGIDRDEFEAIGPTLYSSVSCGAAFVAAIKTDGTLWVAGQGTYGQLGLGAFSIERDEFEQVGSDTWLWVTCLNHSMLAIKSDGSLWGTGYNANGELGLGIGGSGNKNVLTSVDSRSDWAKVEGGQHFAIATRTDGSIYGTGRNTDGELGLNDRVNRNIFTHISSENWRHIQCGGYHTLGIRSNGTLWATGVANSGQLGLGPDVVIAQRVLVLTQVGADSDWNSIAAGEYHSMATKTDNTLHGTGFNYYGELGLGDEILRDVFTQVSGSSWETVYTGFTSSYTLTASGLLYSTGANVNGQLGVNDNNNRNTFTFTTAPRAQLVANGGRNFTFMLTV